MWFEKGLNKTQIYHRLSKVRYVQKIDISSMLRAFNPPKFGEINNLNSRITQLKQSRDEPNSGDPSSLGSSDFLTKLELKNLWHKYEAFQNMIAFSTASAD